MRLIVNNDGYNALHLGKDEDAKDKADELLFGYIDRFLK